MYIALTVCDVTNYNTYVQEIFLLLGGVVLTRERKGGVKFRENKGLI